MQNTLNNKKPGSLSTWLDYLNGIDPDHIDLGLDRVTTILQRLHLDVDLKKIPIIEVAGTNGKGSTCALIASCLEYSGIKTGLYTSPHLHVFNERVVIGSKNVSDTLLEQAFAAVHEARGDDIELTYFEYTTLAALLCYREEKVQALVLEIGLGGRLDAVNALDADIAVISSIGLDHVKILGDTIPKIAFEKAGIIKDKADVIVGLVDKSALDVIADVAHSHDVRLLIEGQNFKGETIDDDNYAFMDCDTNLMLSLPAPRVPDCCVPTAMRVLECLKERGLNITTLGIKKGVAHTSLPGRMQLVHSSPKVYLDVAHNVPAAVHLKDCLQKNLTKVHKNGGRIIGVVGMLKDKDVEGVLNTVAPSFDAFYVASLHTQRGESKERLQIALKKVINDKTLLQSYNYVKDALEHALADAKSNDEIIVFGSFVTVTEAQDYLNNKFN